MTRLLTILALLSPVAYGQDVSVDEGEVGDPAPVSPEVGEDSETLDAAGEENPTSINSSLPPLPYVVMDAETLDAEQAMAQAQLQRYCEKSSIVLIGQVLSVYEQENQQQVSLMVQEGLQGRPRGAVDIQIPAPIATTDPTRIYPKVVEGYQMLVFLNRQGKLIEGNSLFLVQGGFVWRNKRPDAFLQPSANQDWVEQVDPAQDYIMFSMDEIRACLE